MKMRNTEQTQGQNILQHGLSVWDYIRRLLDKDYEGFKLPKWWSEYESRIYGNLHTRKQIKHYCIHHDMGKPDCLVIDEAGRKHFPNHAEISADLWDSTFPKRKVEGCLIRNDMLFHEASDEEIIRKRLSTATICTLILSALAELHSNARMFGGIDSDSFKIKFKRFEKRAKKALHYYFDHRHSYIITRNDLPNSQKAVQGSHASIEMARTFLTKGDEHPSLILTVVKNENKLKAMSKELFEKGIKFVVFREPDRDNEITAIATEPLSFERRRKLSRLQLLRL
jgi:hypothetical protein